MSDVSRAGHGDGFAARSHLPDGASGRGQAGTRRFFRDPHRPLPGLPELPDRLSLGRALRQPAGERTLADRGKLPASMAATQVRRHFYGNVLPSFSRLARMRRLLRFYQRSGLQSLARASGLLKLLGVAELDALSPHIESDFSFRDLGTVFPAEGRAARPRGFADRLHRQRGLCGTESRHRFAC